MLSRNYDPAFMRISTQVPIIVMLAGLVGCQRPQGDPFHAYQPPTQVTLANQNADAVWDSVQETLRNHGYRLDRVDREAGVVTTQPETSQHYFEFWRKDVNTSADFWEATFNTIQRRVEVTMTSPAEGSPEITVVVLKQRLSSPDRQFNSTGVAYKYFGEELPSTTGKEKVTAADDRWIDRGRDPAMELYLLNKITERISQLPG